MSPVSTSISTPALLRGASSILSSSSRMRSGAIRAQQAGVPANGSVRFRFHGHFPGDGKADRPHQAQGIFLKAAVRIPDRPQNSRLNVRHAIHIIHDAAGRVGKRFFKQAVHREVTAPGVFTRIRKIDGVRSAAVAVISVLSERGHLKAETLVKNQHYAEGGTHLP